MSAPWGLIFHEIWTGCLSTALTVFRVLIPLMVIIELLLHYKLIEKMAGAMGFFSRILGIGRDALLPLLVALFMGVSYGAGALAEINSRTPLSKKDIALMSVFIYCCHGVIETTVIFYAVGASPLFVCVFRLLIAVLITMLAARLPRMRALSDRR